VISCSGQVDFVAVRYRDQHVCVFDAGAFQNCRVSRAAGDGAQVQPILQQAKARAVDVHHGDVVSFRNQAFGHAGADLARAEDDDFQLCPSELITR
jgi:hypothetical protein